MDYIQRVSSYYQAVDVVDCLRGFFLLTAGAILLANSIPFVRTRFVTYGPRAAQTLAERDVNSKAAGQRSSWSTRFLDYVASFQVPHSYFTQFYVLSVLSSVLWGIQLVSKGPLFRAISSTVRDANLEKSMSPNQIALCWALLAFQGARRLYECISMAKPSKSKMWFPHWLVGLAYYAAMGIAIWVEGIPALRSSDNLLGKVQLSAPSFKTIVSIPIFILASGIQYDCHLYLTSLKEYTLPTHPAFLNTISPHYTAECAIYLSLAFLAAPQGALVNKTVLSGLIFVVVNLGVSAGNSKEWYMRKFGRENVQHRWRMIPYLY